MKAMAPGKLILSGEHAVVHGRPALVMAVNRHVRVVINPLDAPELRVMFPGVSNADAWPLAALPGLRHRLQENYARFLTGNLGIKQVLSEPVELIHYTIAYALEAANVTLRHGLDITIDSELPVGCGMGSSAAAIAATLAALAGLTRMDVDQDMLYRWTLDVERLQHGHPSGVDPFIVVHGGLVRFQHGEAEALPTPHHVWHVVDTGAPSSTTGESVAQVSASFPGTDDIWTRIQRVTDEMETALRQGEWEDVTATMRANQRLLETIGVVPEPVQQFMREVEAAGGAAKICGAGSIRGKGGGVALAILAPETLSSLCARHGYTHYPVQTEPHGARTTE